MNTFSSVQVASLSQPLSPGLLSTPGNCYALRLAIGNSQSNESLLDSISVFLHPPGEFSFFKEQDNMPNVLKIDFLNLRSRLYRVEVNVDSLHEGEIRPTYSP